MNTIFRNARVIDGTGAESYKAEVSIVGGLITAVGPCLAANGVVEIDAGGLALMPGIIDTHTHFDAQITWDPYVNPSPLLGVTTVVIGNCGFTIAPCREDDRDVTMRNLTQVEGMSLDALRAGIEGVWVNGVQMIRDNAIARASLPGRLIREFDA